MRRSWFQRVVTAVVIAAAAVLVGVRTAPVLEANRLAVSLNHQLLACGFSLLDFRWDACRVHARVERGPTRSAGSLDALAALAAGDTAATLQISQRVLQDRPGDWRTRMVRARALERGGLKDQARVQWSLVGAASAFEALANFHRAAGRCDIALEYLDVASASEPPSGDSYLSQGQCYKALGRIEDAERALRLAVSLLPSQGPPRLELAELLVGRPNASGRAEARALLEKSVALEPRSFVAYQRLGDVLSQAGDHSAAEGVFRKMVDAFPNHHVPAMYLGQAYESQGNYSLAEYWFRRSLDLDRTYSASHYVLGLLYLTRGDPSSEDLRRALEELTLAVRLTRATPHPNASMLFALGQAYLAAGDRVSAAHEFCESLRLQPDYAAAREYLAGTSLDGCVR